MSLTNPERAAIHAVRAHLYRDHVVIREQADEIPSEAVLTVHAAQHTDDEIEDIESNA